MNTPHPPRYAESDTRSEGESVDYRYDTTQQVWWACHWKAGFLVKCIHTQPYTTWVLAQEAAVQYASEHHLLFAGEGPNFG